MEAEAEAEAEVGVGVAIVWSVEAGWEEQTEPYSPRLLVGDEQHYLAGERRAKLLQLYHRFRRHTGWAESPKAGY
jgi:hypothetical protein